MIFLTPMPYPPAIFSLNANWDNVKGWIRNIVDDIYKRVSTTVEGDIYFTEIVAEKTAEGIVKITHKIFEPLKDKKVKVSSHTARLDYEDAPEWVIRKLDEIERRDKKSKKADVKEEILKDAGVSGEELKHALEH